MKAKCVIIILLAMVTSPVIAPARIGETREEIEKRYGPLIKEENAKFGSGKALDFDFHGYTVTVTIVANKSQAELYKKQDQTDFTEDEKMKLLQKNAGSKTWQSKTNRGHYELSDGSISAFCSPKEISILTSGYYETVLKGMRGTPKASDDKKDSTDGF